MPETMTYVGIIPQSNRIPEEIAIYILDGKLRAKGNHRFPVVGPDGPFKAYMKLSPQGICWEWLGLDIPFGNSADADNQLEILENLGLLYAEELN